MISSNLVMCLARYSAWWRVCTVSDTMIISAPVTGSTSR